MSGRQSNGTTVSATTTSRSIVFLLMFALAAGASAQRRLYTVGIGFPFPPWDVGPARGVNYDLLTAICAANTAMRCRIQVRPYSDCVGSDAEGRPIIGPGLTSGSLDGCIGWLDTAERAQLGGEFADPYSFGPTPQLIAADGGGFGRLDDGDSLGGALVGFLAGFFNNPTCLARHHDDFETEVFEGSEAGRAAMLAALTDGTLDLAFWDSVETVPAGTHTISVASESRANEPLRYARDSFLRLVRKRSAKAAVAPTSCIAAAAAFSASTWR
ncbi:MAG TPA: hypothetical protein VHR17_15160 [Thermoanaerobaculia bacterium]|jgi:hypothetical protein|nr:hypothetical protein [Thermoanaerobaculia bacterium]